MHLMQYASRLEVRLANTILANNTRILQNLNLLRHNYSNCCKGQLFSCGVGSTKKAPLIHSLTHSRFITRSLLIYLTGSKPTHRPEWQVSSSPSHAATSSINIFGKVSSRWWSPAAESGLSAESPLPPIPQPHSTRTGGTGHYKTDNHHDG